MDYKVGCDLHSYRAACPCECECVCVSKLLQSGSRVLSEPHCGAKGRAAVAMEMDRGGCTDQRRGGSVWDGKHACNSCMNNSFDEANLNCTVVSTSKHHFLRGNVSVGEDGELWDANGSCQRYRDQQEKCCCSGHFRLGELDMFMVVVLLVAH